MKWRRTSHGTPGRSLRSRQAHYRGLKASPPRVGAGLRCETDGTYLATEIIFVNLLPTVVFHCFGEAGWWGRGAEGLVTRQEGFLFFGQGIPQACALFEACDQVVRHLGDDQVWDPFWACTSYCCCCCCMGPMKLCCSAAEVEALRTPGRCAELGPAPQDEVLGWGRLLVGTLVLHSMIGLGGV